MKLSEFSAIHKVERPAVWQYIRRHPEIAEHTSQGAGTGSLELDEKAVELLEKKYPMPPAPVQVVDDAGLYRELAETNKALADARAELLKAQQPLLSFRGHASLRGPCR